LAFDQNRRLQAFRIIQNFPDYQTIYLAGAAKLPLAMPHLIRKITQRILTQVNPIFVVARTQNDFVLDAMEFYCPGRVTPIDHPPDNQTLDLIRNINLCHHRLNPDSLIIPGYYGGQPMVQGGLRPRSRNDRIRNLTNQLDYDHGDALLLIGQRREG